MNFKLEVIIIPVSDVDRAKKFYENLCCGSMVTSSRMKSSASYNSLLHGQRRRSFLGRELLRPSLA